MAEKLFKGFQLLDGTKEGFTLEGLDPDKVYFIRTSEDKECGYIYFNGKKYGNINGIDCGTY